MVVAGVVLVGLVLVISARWEEEGTWRTGGAVGVLVVLCCVELLFGLELFGMVV